MNKFLIERTVPGIQNVSAAERQQVWAESNAVLAEMGPDIQWAHSYVTDDKIHCVYYAADQGLIREHARRGGFPCDTIMLVDDVVDPTRVGVSSMPTLVASSFDRPDETRTFDFAGAAGYAAPGPA